MDEQYFIYSIVGTEIDFFRLMLSLLSLFLASGPVLRDDTQHWSPNTYPNPQINYTLCNTWPASTLCDPDHILTDHWRMIINKNIQEQIES